MIPALALLLALLPGLFARWSGRRLVVHTLGGASPYVLLAVLLAWAIRWKDVFLFLLRATPLDRPELTPHLDSVVGRSGLKAPILFRAGSRDRHRRVPAGGQGVMAVALGEDVVGLIRHDGPGSRVAVYRPAR